jgi:predicted DNA-binding transcriptional regulator AlpA
MTSKVLYTIETQLYGSKQTCTVLSISKPSLWRWMHKPGFPEPLRIDPMNPRSRLRFRVVDIIRWVEEQQQRTTALKKDTGSLGTHHSR